MSARNSTDEATWRAPLAGRAAAARPSVRLAMVILAALLALTLALTSCADAFVYWESFDQIGRANLDGTGVNENFIVQPPYGGTGDRCGVALDAAHVYWASSGFETIARANLDGTGVDYRFIDFGLPPGGFPQKRPCGVAVDDEHVYWANQYSGTIGRANLDGTGVDQDFITGARAPRGVAVDAAHLYWANLDGTIGRADLDGTGADQSFITGASEPCGVAIDAAHVYWANRVPETIGRANLDGTGADQSFITGADGPCGVAVDAAYVYWSNSRRIGRASLDGTGVNQSFIGALIHGHNGGVAVDALRSFSFGKVKTNEKRGTAKLTVEVPGPGGVELARTKQVKGKRKRAEVAGELKLPIEPKGKAERRLKRKGKARVEARVTYTPEGGDPNIVANTDTKTVKLVRARLGEAGDAIHRLATTRIGPNKDR